jgi:RimJ/RimL family protein N-acetyltransferase
LTGLTQVSDSKPERVLCKPADVVEFVCKGLGDRVEEYQPCLSLGIYYKGLIGGILIHDLRPEIDCYLTIYTTSKRWATKSVLKYVFGIIFNLMKCRRCSVLVSKANSKSLKMCEQLGFKVEGLLRQYRDDGDDCYCLGMLKSECKWNE